MGAEVLSLQRDRAGSGA